MTMGTRCASAARAGFAPLVLLLIAGSFPARADGARSTSCVSTRGSFNCVTTWRGGLGDAHITHVPGPISDQEDTESRERDRLWQVRCKPVVRQDEYGVPRYRYAARGCEYGRLD
jgi:hypothetical protein